MKCTHYCHHVRYKLCDSHTPLALVHCQQGRKQVPIPLLLCEQRERSFDGYFQRNKNQQPSFKTTTVLLYCQLTRSVQLNQTGQDALTAQHTLLGQIKKSIKHDNQLRLFASTHIILGTVLGRGDCMAAEWPHPLSQLLYFLLMHMYVTI